MIYDKTIVPGLNRFYRGHFQNTPNIKTFFSYATITHYQWIVMIYTSFDTSINLIKTKKVTCQNSVTTLYCGRRIKTFHVLQGKAVVTHAFFTCDTTKWMQFQECVMLCGMACADNATTSEKLHKIKSSEYSGNFSVCNFCWHTLWPSYNFFLWWQCNNFWKLHCSHKWKLPE